MANLLEASGKEFFLANEDWIGDPSSKTRINGGLLFAKNTEFTRALFADMLAAHQSNFGLRSPQIGGGPMRGCGSNEQLCLDSIRKRETFSKNVLIASGKQYNCGITEQTMKRLRD